MDDNDPAALQAAGEAQRRLDAVVIETVAEIEARSLGLRDERLATRQGCRNANELLQRVLGVDARDAARAIRASAVVRRRTEVTSGAPLPARWPALRGALLDGRIGLGGMLAATGPVEQAGARIGDVDRLRAELQALWKKEGSKAAELAVQELHDDAGLDLYQNPVALKPLYQSLRKAWALFSFGDLSIDPGFEFLRELLVPGFFRVFCHVSF